MKPWDSVDQVRGKRLKDRMVRRILRKADFLIAHNAAFDRRFVEKLYPETQRFRWYCSMNGIWCFEGIAATDEHGIETERGHRALMTFALHLLAQRDEQTDRPYLSELLGVADAAE